MRWETLLLIFGMAIVTFIPRFVPMAFLSRWVIPERVKVGLEYIPVAILSAIIFPILFFDAGGTFTVQPQFLLSALPVFAFAWKMKNLWGSVILGMLIYLGLGFVLERVQGVKDSSDQVNILKALSNI
jgi:branched-subunit amino acid transport protein